MPPGPEQAREIARELCASALAWGQRLFGCVARLERSPAPRRGSAGQNEELAEELGAEVLAYGFCRLQMRLERSRCPGGKDWLALVKRECEALKEGQAWRRRNRHKRLSAPAKMKTPFTSEGSPDVESDRPAEASQLTREMFEQFCRNTGLGSNVLVGKGENLAALVFYMALHGVWSAHKTLTNEQVLHLLRAAQQCRLQLDQSLSRWFSSPQPPASTKALPASTGSGLRLATPGSRD